MARWCGEPLWATEPSGRRARRLGRVGKGENAISPRHQQERRAGQGSPPGSCTPPLTQADARKRAPERGPQCEGGA
eukprot:gene1131-13729_t